MRGGIVDVYPSTADLPVRIDLWGDEVDRLTEFDPGDQRSVADLDARRAVRLPRGAAHAGGARPRRRAGGVRAVGTVAVGAPGRGTALRRHGVVAAVARGRRARSCPTSSGGTGASCWSTPGASATGPHEMIEEEVALARALAVTWGVVADGPDAAAADAVHAAVPAPARGLRAPVGGHGRPGVVVGAGRRFPEHGGDHGARHRARARRPRPARGAVVGAGGAGVLVTLCAEGAGSAARLAAVLAEEGLSVPVVDDGADLSQAGIRVVVAPLERGVVVASAQAWPSLPKPTSPAAAGPTAPRGPGPGRPTASSTPWRRGTSSCTVSTAWRATAGW